MTSKDLPAAKPAVAHLLKRAAQLLAPGSLNDFRRECAEAARKIDTEAERVDK